MEAIGEESNGGDMNEDVEIVVTTTDKIAAVQHKIDALSAERREIEAKLSEINNVKGGKWKAQRTPLVQQKTKIENEMADLKARSRMLHEINYREKSTPPDDGNNAQLKAIRGLLERVVELMEAKNV